MLKDRIADVKKEIRAGKGHGTGPGPGHRPDRGLGTLPGPGRAE